MKIVLGPSSTKLGEKIAELLKLETLHIVFKRFPDGESYIQLVGEIQNEDVVIVQTTSPPQDTSLIQLAFIADASKRYGAKKTIAVVPYLAYARQDKVFLKGETISIEAIARMLKATGVDSLMTVNIHQEKVLAKFPFPTQNLSAISLLAAHFKQKCFEEVFSLAPDEGAMYIVEEANKVLKGEYGYLEKHRDKYTGKVKVEKKRFAIKGKTVIIFDDIISTGSTIIAAAQILKELKPEKVYAACVHPLMIGKAEKRILETGVEEIIGTDSVPSHVSKVSLAPLISKEMKALISG